MYEQSKHYGSMMRKMKNFSNSILQLDAGSSPNYNQQESKQISSKDMMADNKMVERYSKYLNRQFFKTKDQFIRKKH